MAKYDINDYMPKGQPETEPASNENEQAGVENEPVSNENEQAGVETEPRTMEPLDLTPELITEVPEKPVKPQSEPVPAWSRYISALFSPLLIATYTVVLTMWITPLSEVPERPRFSATLMIFLITALAPMAYILTMVRMGRIRSVDIPTRQSRIIPAIVSVICLIIGSFYLGKVHAPEWLCATPKVYAVSTAVFIVLNFIHMVSGHTMNMGTMTGILLYLGVNDYIDVPVSSVVAVAFILTGLVGSARVAVGRHSIADTAIGAAAGLVVGYGFMAIF